MNKKTVIGLLILLAIIVVGTSAYVIINKYQESAKLEKIKESEEEAARLLDEQHAKKHLEIAALQEKVLTLFSSADKDFLAEDISDDKFKEVNTIISEQEGENLSDESLILLNTILIDYRQAKAMYNIQESIAALTPEDLLTEEGTAKLTQIQAILDKEADLDTKKLFTKQQQTLIDELKAQVESME